MPHTYTANRIHVVFSTKGRRPLITPEIQPRLWAYMSETAKNRGIHAITAGGFTDHAHLLIGLPPTMPLAKAMQTIKGISSKWMNQGGQNGFAWQDGYSAFSVSTSQVDAVVHYIQTQADHHAKHTFDAELFSLLKKNGVEFDPRFVLG